jgi:hypothetical protein
MNKWTAVQRDTHVNYFIINNNCIFSFTRGFCFVQVTESLSGVMPHELVNEPMFELIAIAILGALKRYTHCNIQDTLSQAKTLWKI